MAKKYESLEEVKQMLRECIDDDDSPEDAKEAARRALAAVDEDDEAPAEDQPVTSVKGAAKAQMAANTRRQMFLDGAAGVELRQKLREMHGISPAEKAAMASLPAAQLRAAMLKRDPCCFGVDGVVDDLKRLRGR